jgi:hypothetical protein
MLSHVWHSLLQVAFGGRAGAEPSGPTEEGGTKEGQSMSGLCMYAVALDSREQVLVRQVRINRMKGRQSQPSGSRGWRTSCARGDPVYEPCGGWAGPAAMWLVVTLERRWAV